MKGAFRLFIFARIPVYVHWSFFLLGLLIPYYSWKYSFDAQVLMISVILFFALFACVIFHEYGHALAARRYGVETRDIILLPMGGIARLEKLPKKPGQEFWVAAAGPAVNLLIALILGGVIFFGVKDAFNGMISGKEKLLLDWNSILPLLFLLNLFLALFNLIPAFPLDGGRMFRALLAIPMGRIKATRIATIVGQILAVSLAGFGIYYGDFMSTMLGGFIFLMATQEYRSVKTESILSAHPLAAALKEEFLFLEKEESLARPIHLWNQEKKGRDYLVLDQNREVVGILASHQIKPFKNHPSPDTLLIADYLNPIFSKLTPSMHLFEGLRQLQDSNFELLPVYDDEKLLGVLDYDGINQFLRQLKKS